MHLKMPIVFDNDCIASFSWINRLDIINTLFPGQIIIPEAVYRELSKMKKKKYPYVFYSIEKEINAKNFTKKRHRRYRSAFKRVFTINCHGQSQKDRPW